MITILLAIFGIIFLFFLPGFFAMNIIVRIAHFSEPLSRLSIVMLSIILSMAIAPTVTFVLNIVGIPMTMETIFLELTVLTMLLGALLLVVHMRQRLVTA